MVSNHWYTDLKLFFFFLCFYKIFSVFFRTVLTDLITRDLHEPNP
ncbi:hypothetical protein MtrunA17_Chr1g0207421 [Medicago truncatula]|uniref:Transmembrane protein n=1 Tax=Medicago truncatula TaxID=3880 RepID=A0A396K1X3_MEDTR|nr:hypothetical protein MtrunA17_Chr1g0207421 [Medicago truncatula]